MEKEHVLLLLDYGVGPIVGCASDENGREITKIDAIDNDPTIKSLVEALLSLYNSCITVVDFSDENPAGFEFNETREKEVAFDVLALAEQLVRRIQDVGDGKIEVEDRITPYFKKLI